MFVGYMIGVMAIWPGVKSRSYRPLTGAEVARIHEAGLTYLNLLSPGHPAETDAAIRAKFPIRLRATH